MMKRPILLLFTCLAVLPALAGPKKLDDMTARLRQFHCISMRFSYTALQEMSATMPDTARWQDAVRGRLLVMDGRFKLFLPQMEILSDGHKTYQYLPGVKEINVMPVDTTAQTDITARPDLLLTRPGAFFDAVELPAGTDGRTAFLLTPRNRESSLYQSLILWMDGKTGLPAALCAATSDGQVVAMGFSRIEDDRSADAAAFAFRRADYPADAEIIDMTF